MIRFIDEHRDRFTIKFICKTLNTQRVNGFISSCGYRQVTSRGPSTRALRDTTLVEVIRRVHAENYGVYGVRKMWHALRRDGIDSGQKQTAHLMRLAGLSGKGKRGTALMITRPPKGPDARPDLVKRDFQADTPGRLSVADITYIRTKSEFVYAALVIDVFSRRIAG